MAVKARVKLAMKWLGADRYWVRGLCTKCTLPTLWKRLLFVRYERSMDTVKSVEDEYRGAIGFRWGSFCTGTVTGGCVHGEDAPAESWMGKES